MKRKAKKTIRPMGYWQDWENVERELKQLIKKLKHFPNDSELRDIVQGDIHQGIRNFGGVHKVRKKMGYTPSSMKPAGYWKEWNNVKRELKGLTKELGHFPSSSYLIHVKGHCSLAYAIPRYHGGFNKVRKKMGCKIVNKPSGYWQDFGNIESELEVLIKRLRRFPSYNEIVDSGKSSLVVSMQSYHGGIRAVRERMGYSNSRYSNGVKLKSLLEEYIDKK